MFGQTRLYAFTLLRKCDIPPRSCEGTDMLDERETDGPDDADDDDDGDEDVDEDEDEDEDDE